MVPEREREFAEIVSKGLRSKYRKSAKEKSLVDHLKEMECLGVNKDDAWEEEVSKDTRGPILYAADPSFKVKPNFRSLAERRHEQIFWQSTRELFRILLHKAIDPSARFKPQDLPLVFRFALRRPLMPEMLFRTILIKLKIDLDFGQGSIRLAHTHPKGRLRELCTGIDYEDVPRIGHVSGRLRHRLSQKDNTSLKNTEPVGESTDVSSFDGDEVWQQLKIYKALLDVFFRVEEGQLKSEEAPNRYRAVMNLVEPSDEHLIEMLKTFRMPVHHIPSTNQKSSPEPIERFPFLDGEEWQDEGISHYEDLRSEIVSDPNHKRVLAQIKFLVRIHREEPQIYNSESTIRAILEVLDHLLLDPKTLGDFLSDPSEGVEQAALLIWDDAQTNFTEFMDEDCEDGNIETGKPQQEVSPNAESKEEIVFFADGEGSGEAPAPLPFDITAWEQEVLESQGQVFPDKPISKESLDSRQLIRAHSPEALASAIEDGSLIKNDGQPPPEDNNLTNDLFGIVMTKKEARELRHKIGLPADSDKIMVISTPPEKSAVSRELHAQAHKASSRSKCQASTLLESSSAKMSAKRQNSSVSKKINTEAPIILSRSKRKASLSLESSSPTKSARFENFDLFAREGETAENFVLSHYDSNVVGEARSTCSQKLSKRDSESEHLPNAERWCARCDKEPCICASNSRGLQDDGDSVYEAGLAPSTHFTSRLHPPSTAAKSSILTYLSSAMGDDDVLTTLRSYEKLPMSAHILTRVKDILNHVNQGVQSGELQPKREDEEAKELLLRLNRRYSECSKKRSIVDSDSHTGSNSLLEYLSRVTNDDEVLSSLRTLSKEAFSDGTIERVGILVAHMSDAVRSRQYDPTLPSRTSEETETRDLMRLLGQKWKSREIQTEEDEKFNPVMTYLRSAMEDSVLRKYVRELFDSPVSLGKSVEVERLLNCLRLGMHSEKITTYGPGKGDQILGSMIGKLTHQQAEMKRFAEHRFMQVAMKKDILTPKAKLQNAAQRQDQSKQSGTPKLQEVRPECVGPISKSPKKGNPSTSHPPIRAGRPWLFMGPRTAVELARKKALEERKSFDVYLEELRAKRTHTKKQREEANLPFDLHRFFQNPNSSSGSTSATALNKVFDRYRGRSAVLSV